MMSEQVAVNKKQKKVFMIDGYNLRLFAEVRSRTDVIWAENVDETVKSRYASLSQ